MAESDRLEDPEDAQTRLRRCRKCRRARQRSFGGWLPVEPAADALERAGVTSRVAARGNRDRARAALDDSLGRAAGTNQADATALGRPDDDHRRLLAVREPVQRPSRRSVGQQAHGDLRPREVRGGVIEHALGERSQHPLLFVVAEQITDGLVRVCMSDEDRRAQKVGDLLPEREGVGVSCAAVDRDDDRLT